MRYLLYILTTITFSSVLAGQTACAQGNINPEGAFIRSLFMPGWGHYYVNNEKWTRGQIHLGAEAALIAAYVGFSIRSDNLEDHFISLASLKAGVDIDDRSRSFRIAIGDFNSLKEYNDFQLRSRNWHLLFDSNSSNQWNWETDKDREHYNELRSDVDQVENQLPAIIGLMVLNRVVSAVSAYNHAKKIQIPEVSLLPVKTKTESIGVVARLKFHF